MPFATTGGSLITGANVVDASLSVADFSVATLAQIRPTNTTLFLRPNYYESTVPDAIGVTGNTTLNLGHVIVPFQITPTQVSFRCSGVTVAGTCKVAMFSEDGQTQIFSVTTATINAASVVTTALSSPVINPGMYWIAILPVGTANVNVFAWSWQDGIGDNALVDDVTGKAVINGILTVTASTMPATITPTSVTGGTSSRTLIARLDA